LQLYLIGGLIFSFLVAIFALWNSTEIIIRFPFLGEFTTSQALVIIGSATLGAVITMIFSLVKSLKMNLQIKKQMKTIRDYEQIIDKMKKQIEEKQMEEKNSQTLSYETPNDPLQ
jgi:putative membrane protein